MKKLTLIVMLIVVGMTTVKAQKTLGVIGNVSPPLGENKAFSSAFGCVWRPFPVVNAYLALSNQSFNGDPDVTHINTKRIGGSVGMGVFPLFFIKEKSIYPEIEIGGSYFIGKESYEKNILLTGDEWGTTTPPKEAIDFFSVYINAGVLISERKFSIMAHIEKVFDEKTPIMLGVSIKCFIL